MYDENTQAPDQETKAAAVTSSKAQFKKSFDEYKVYRFHVTQSQGRTDEVQFAYLKLELLGPRVQVAKVTSPGDFNPRESPSNTANSDLSLKFYGRMSSVEAGRSFFYELSSASRLVCYELFTANDCPHRDPRSWTISGGDSLQGPFTVLDVISDCDSPKRRFSSYGIFTIRKANVHTASDEDKLDTELKQADDKVNDVPITPIELDEEKPAEADSEDIIESDVEKPVELSTSEEDEPLPEKPVDQGELEEEARERLARLQKETRLALESKRKAEAETVERERRAQAKLEKARLEQQADARAAAAKLAQIQKEIKLAEAAKARAQAEAAEQARLAKDAEQERLHRARVAAAEEEAKTRKEAKVVMEDVPGVEGEDSVESDEQKPESDSDLDRIDSDEEKPAEGEEEKDQTYLGPWDLRQYKYDTFHLRSVSGEEDKSHPSNAGGWVCAGCFTHVCIYISHYP